MTDTSLRTARTLGDLCDLVGRQVDPSLKPDAVYLGLEHIPSGRLRVTAHGRAREVKSSKALFEPGDVLLSKLRPYLDKAVLAETGGMCTTELLVLRAKPGTDPRFLDCVVHRADFIDHAMAGVTGAQHPRTSWSHLARFEIADVSLADQRAIGEFLWRVHDLLAVCERSLHLGLHLKRAAARELLKQGLRRSGLRASPFGPAPENWEIVPLGTLGKIGNGSTPKKSHPEYWHEGVFPWLTSAKVYDGDITAADRFVTDQALEKCHLPILQPGTVLVAITGQGKTLGHCAVLHIEATISQHLAYIQPDAARIDPQFLRGFLDTQYDFLRQVGLAGGSTKAALTCAFLRDLPIPLPSLDEQHEIVRILNILGRWLDVQRRKKTSLERMFHRLLVHLTDGEVDVHQLTAKRPGEKKAA
ncbi:MAG TPA: restriction endonuclease subunit S [Solirubrobacteraceae bacterium]|jgi:type I restriction enzyme S subunit